MERKTPSHGQTGPRKPYLQISQITKKFGEFTALDSIDLEVYEGEFLCFVGPSGCGKTTLLRAIAGLDVQSYGTITQAGRDISSLPPSERDFGIVFQSYALFPNMTVFKNVAYGLENQKLTKKKIRKRVRELLVLVGLADQEKKYPAQLSGGQQQRVAFARALATSPGLLLLDEPLSALDAKVRGHLRQEMKELQSRLGVTTIMVTHDQEEALTMGDRIVVMSEGKIEQVGTPMEVYHQPASVFVADFIGTMNFLPGKRAADTISVGELSFAAAGEPLYAEGPEEVTLAFRPEAVQLGNPALCGNEFEAEVTRFEFLGSNYRAKMQPTGHEHLSLTADISAELFHELGIALGKRVQVGIPEPAIKVFAA